MMKRVLALMLVLVLCLGMLPVAAMAEEVPEEDVASPAAWQLPAEDEEEPEEPDDGDYGPGFNPYVFGGEDDTPFVQLQPELMDLDEEQEEVIAEEPAEDFDADGINATVPTPVLLDASYDAEMGEGSINFTTTVPDANCFELVILTKEEPESPFGVENINGSTYYWKGLSTAPADEASILGKNGDVLTLSLRQTVYFGSNSMPQDGEVLYFAVQVEQIIGGSSQLSALSNLRKVVVGAQPVDPMPIDAQTKITSAEIGDINATVVFTTTRTGAEYYGIYGLTEESLSSSMGQINHTGTVFNIRAIASAEEGMKGVTIVKKGSTFTVTVETPLYYAANEPYSVGEVANLAVEAVSNVGGKYVSHGISEIFPVTVGTINGTIPLTPEKTKVELEDANFTYTGSPIRPAVNAVLWNGKPMTEGKDYSVKYYDNINAGMGMVTVIGEGDFSGSVKAVFKIAPVSLSSPDSNVTVSLTPEIYAYTGEAVEPKPVVSFGDRTLTEGKDYALRYENNVDIADAKSGNPPTVFVEGKEPNFCDAVNCTFSIAEFCEVSFDTHGGSPVASLLVPPNTRALDYWPDNPVKDGSRFYKWYRVYKDGEYSEPFDFASENFTSSLTLHARYVPEEMTFGRDYLLLGLGREYSFNITFINVVVEIAPKKAKLVTDLDPDLAALIEWSTESNTTDVIKVDQSGKVKAVGPGTDYVIAWLPFSELTARCRIDVLDTDLQQNATITATLPEAKATTELYQTDYTRVHVVLGLQQNLRKAGAQNDGDDGLFWSTDGGIAIREAVFADEAANAVFELRPVDDRTLEIVPKIDVNDAAAVKAVKANYKSSIVLLLSNGEQVPTPTLTLTVKKTLPKVTAEAVKLNSFIDGHTLPLRFGGSGAVTAIAENKPNTVGAFAELNATEQTVKLKDGAQKGSGKLFLTCTLDGWAKTADVSVSVSAAYTAPKLSFKSATLTLNPGFKGDSASTAFTLTPVAGAANKVSGWNVYEGKTLLRGAPFDISIGDGSLTVSNAQAEAAGRTFKLYPLVDGKEVSAVTVKVTKSLTATLTVKAAGTIDTAIVNSPVTLTMSGKNFNTGVGSWSLQITRTDKAKNEELVYFTDIIDDGLFNVSVDGAVITLTGTELLKNFVAGYTYTATVTELTSGAVAKAVKFTVKTSAKAPAVSVSCKTAGAIDVIRLNSFFTVTPTVKNWYLRPLQKSDLHFYVKDGKDYREVDPHPFTVECENGVFTVSQCTHIMSTDKYFFAIAADDIPQAKLSYTAAPVKMGTSAVAQSTKAITLSKNDCFDRQTVVLSVDDDALTIDFAEVFLDAKSAEILQLTKLDDGVYAIGYKDNKLPANIDKLKSVQAKLNVFLDANWTHNFNGTFNGTANKTISVTVNFA